MEIFVVMDDRNVLMEMMNVIVIVCISLNDVKFEMKMLGFFLAIAETGLSIWTILLIVLAFLLLTCIVSTGKKRKGGSES